MSSWLMKLVRAQYYKYRRPSVSVRGWFQDLPENTETLECSVPLLSVLSVHGFNQLQIETFNPHLVESMGTEPVDTGWLSYKRESNPAPQGKKSRFNGAISKNLRTAPAIRVHKVTVPISKRISLPKNSQWHRICYLGECAVIQSLWLSFAISKTTTCKHVKSGSDPLRQTPVSQAHEIPSANRLIYNESYYSHIPENTQMAHGHLLSL